MAIRVNSWQYPTAQVLAAEFSGGDLGSFIRIVWRVILGQMRRTRKPGKPPRPTKLRIIGGEMRGRPIEYHGASFTRPMKDNIRENLFNILGPSVRGSICFDLFAGTGALGFEALSRGASSAVMMEQNRRAAGFIQQTADRLGVGDRVDLLIGDAFHLALPRLCDPQDDTPWIVFLCPPYSLWEESLESLNRIIRQTMQHAPLGSVLVAETEKRFDPDRLSSGSWDFRVYGGTRLGFLEAEARCGFNLPVPESDEFPL